MNIEEIKKVVDASVKEAVSNSVKETIGSSLKEIIEASLKQQGINSPEEKPQTSTIHKSITEGRIKDQEIEKRIEREKGDAVFVKTIYNEVDSNKVFLPEDIKKIIDACIASGETDGYRAELIKKEVAQRVFEIQDNMDKLSDHSRAKVKEYLHLTDEAKLAKAEEVWPLVNEVVNVKKNLYSQDEKRKQKMSPYSTNDLSTKQTAIIQNAKDVLLGKKKLDY